MKNLLIIILLHLFTLSLFSQGWVGNSSTNSLYSINSSLNLSPVNIGIGNNTPNNRLEITHGTIGKTGLRFTNLLNATALSTNINGDVEQAVLDPANGLYWGLTGNSGTNGANFIGTTDNQNIVFKTNASISPVPGTTRERFRIAENRIIQTPYFATNSTFLNGGNETTNANSIVGIGVGSLASVSYTYHTVAIGNNSLFSLKTGIENTSIGYNSMFNATNGSANVATGHSALFSLTSGSGNVAIGHHSGKGIKLGINNTLLGGTAAPLMEGSNNVMIGNQNASQLLNGTHNIFIGGYETGCFYFPPVGNKLPVTNSVNSIFIGSGIYAKTNNSDNEIIIGTAAIGNGSNSFTYGNTSILKHIFSSGFIGVGTNSPLFQFELSTDAGAKPLTSTWTITSDERLKNIKGSYNKGLTEILKLNPIEYYYKNSESKIFDETVLKEKAVGYSAQEVQKIFPEAIIEDKKGYLNLNIHPILIAYTNAIKELNTKFENQNNSVKENDKLKLEIENLKLENDLMKLKFEFLEKSIIQLCENGCIGIEKKLNLDILYQSIPNPTDNIAIINYRLNSNNIVKAEISLYSQDGKILKNFTLNPTQGIGNIKVELSDLSSGIYLYNLNINNKIVDSKNLQLIK